MAEIKICSMPDCDREPRYGQRYCPKCHARYMKAWRAKKRRQQQKIFAEVLQLRTKCEEQRTEIEALRAKLQERM